MNETPYPSDQNELSDDDLAVLRAFDLAENLVLKNPASGRSTQEFAPVDPTIAPSPHSTDPLPLTSDVSDDMLVLFVTEADGEIAAMRQALHELEQDTPDDPTNSANFAILQRSAHKLKGTAGSIGYEHISTIARYIETFVERVKIGTMTHSTGLIALAHAVEAVEATLYSVASEGRESSTSHAELDLIYNALNVEIRTADAIMPSEAMASEPRPSIQVDAQQLEQLMLHIEQLAEQRTSLASAQAQVESAQYELYTAQLRLQQLEILLSTHPSALKTGGSAGDDETPMSSLVARILNESIRRIGHLYRRKNRSHPQSQRSQEGRDAWHWDELEIDPETKGDVLIHSLSEAVADVATASARLRTALEQLSHTLQKHMIQTAIVRTDALHLPHAHSPVRGLLIRAGSQRVVVPFAQVQRIDYEKNVQYNPLYMLNLLLGFPTEQAFPQTVRAVLILQQHSVAVQVDEVLGEVEVVMKPLAAHLQRPGIAGTATDDIGEGNVLLVLDLPELVIRTDPAQQVSTKEVETSQQRRTILIADDSVYIRQSVLQILNHAGYEVMEAHDGIEALEKLLTSRIDALLLDIEMPRLNGYDLLNILRDNPQFARLKVVMLTSRSSERHQRHAYELGAQAYLTKPCPQDTLLTTIQSLIN